MTKYISVLLYENLLNCFGTPNIKSDHIMCIHVQCYIVNLQVNLIS